MHAQFGLEPAVGEFAAHHQGGAGDASLVARFEVEHLGLVIRFLTEALVHAQKHVGPVAGFGAARAGMQRDDGVVPIHRPGEQHAQFQFVQRLRCGLKVGLKFGSRLIRPVLQGEFAQRLQVFHAAFEILERIELGADGVGFADELLCRGAIVPESLIGHAGLDLGEAVF